MLTDLQIAQAAVMQPITQIARQAGADEVVEADQFWCQ